MSGHTTYTKVMQTNFGLLKKQRSAQGILYLVDVCCS